MAENQLGDREDRREEHQYGSCPEKSARTAVGDQAEERTRPTDHHRWDVLLDS
jgi:hypothetical protein